MVNFPPQRLSYKKKSEDNFKWAKETVDSILDFSPSTASEYTRQLSNYRLFNNILDQADFETDCNRMGIEVGQFKQEILPYNKTYNKIQVLLGEELARPFNFKTVLVNEEGIKSKLEYKNKMLKDYVLGQLEKTIEGLQLRDNPSPTLDPKDIDKYMSTTYLDAREILASKLLKYLTKKLSLKELKNDAFKHGLISGQELAYIGYRNSEPYVEILNPLTTFYHKSPETKYVEDALFAGSKIYMTPTEIIDKFGMYLSEEDLKKVEGQNIAHGGQIAKNMEYGHNDFNHLFPSSQPVYEGSYSTPSSGNNNILVQHVEWRSYTRVGFLTFTNEFGDEEETIVSEDFKVPSYAKKLSYTKEYNRKCTYYVWSHLKVEYKLEWQYIPEIWSAIKIADDIYTMIGPKIHQFRSKDDPFTVKLGYHGTTYSSMNASPVSLMDRMRPFQYLYFIVMHKLKDLIAKDKGKVYHFDTSMFDPSIGLEKTMYYLDQLDIDFYNPLQNAEQPGSAQRGKISSTSDRSNAQHINNYIGILNSLDQQISDVAGVSRQREGQTANTEAVTNAQSNIRMSSLITEVYFHTHNRLWERILNSLLDISSSIYAKNKKALQYVLDDYSLSTLELTSDAFDNSQLGVFVTDSANEHDFLNTLKAEIRPLIEASQGKISSVIKFYRMNSIEDIERALLSSEQEMLAQQQQQIQQEQEANAQLQQQAQEFQTQREERKYEHEKEIALIESFKFQRDQDLDNNNVPDQLEVDKFLHTVKKDERTFDLKEKELELKEKALNKPSPSK